MSRYTSAYSSLILRLREVTELQSLAAEYERQSAIIHKEDAAKAIKHTDKINALCRGSIVLLNSHIEGYIKELGELALERIVARRADRQHLSDQFFYYLSQDILKQIGNTTEPKGITAKVFALISRDIDLWSRFGNFDTSLPAERFNDGFANPAFRKVRKYFNRFGYERYQNDLRARMSGEYWAAVTAIDQIVAVRNKIAHGDTTTKSTPDDIAKKIVIVQGFCKGTDDVFAKWCKGNLCSIR